MTVVPSCSIGFPGGSTSGSLIARIKRHEPDAWRKLADIYTPLVYGWARRGGLIDADAADIVQDVFQLVYRHSADFGASDQHTSFRGWLWAITRNQVRLFYRRRGDAAVAQGGTVSVRQLNEYPDWIESETEPVTCTELHALLQRTLAVIRSDFDANTWQAFWRLTVEGHAANDIAEELGISRGAVRQAKYRVLCRLREEMGS